MPTPDPKPGKSKKKKSKPAAPNWPNYTGSGRLPVAKLPLMGAAEADIAASYLKLTSHLDGLSSDEARLACCESMFGQLVGNLQIGPSKNLRAGIVLALVEKADWYLSRPNQHKDPLYKRKFTQYQTELLHQCNLGKSNSQVSRMRRAGDLFIRLVEAKLPVPETAERLVRMLYFKDAAFDQWRTMVGNSKGVAPDLKQISECIRNARIAAGKMPAKPAEPVNWPVLIVKHCSCAVIQLKKVPPNIDVALVHLDLLLDEVNGNSPSDKAAASAQPEVKPGESYASVPPGALESGMAKSVPAAADEEETGLRYLVARHGTEVRITRHSNVDLTPNDVAWVVSFADNSPYDWRSRNSEERPDDTCPEGEWRCSNQTEAGAQECYAATVARVKKLSWSGPDVKP